MTTSVLFKLFVFTALLAMVSGAEYHQEKPEATPMDAAHRANRRECKVQLALFTVSLCGDVCDSESAVDLVKMCCPSKCTAEQVVKTCCPVN
ncbi:hypothetical protein B9Z55_008166 [Caenorhabditis nigoni]|uniref:Uncharacterized protein n=1 Tax=Caenorhabditis nigoni TaxID=1611254 RepID=A0A2G5VCX8_9PELO|nr:hypothetical protein B9Z55_008166 [Caenorhabditis nigoni]